MDPIAEAVLASWTLDLKVVCLLFVVAVLYISGAGSAFTLNCLVSTRWECWLPVLADYYGSADSRIASGCLGRTVVGGAHDPALFCFRRSISRGRNHVGSGIDSFSCSRGDAGDPGPHRSATGRTHSIPAIRRVKVQRVPTRASWDLLRTPILGPILRYRHFRR